jgi:adenylate cyclase
VPGDSNEDARALAALREAGITADAIERAVARGDVQGALFDAILLPRIAERTVSAAEIEARGGLTVTALAELFEALGLPAPAPTTPAFTPFEAEAFTMLAGFEDVWSPELRIRSARVYGRQLARIAHTELQLFREVEPRLGTGGAAMRQLQSAIEQWQPISEALLIGVHSRWLEHELAQAAVDQAETAARGHPLPGAAEVTIAFCDLKDFTHYADLNGDAAAVEAIDRFSEVVTRERGERVRLTKLLGDGVMLVYGDTREAAAATARIVTSVREHSGPDVHASLHTGVAIAREGDYFGSAVNVAARLLAMAGGNEVLSTQPVVLATAEEMDWEHIGSLEIRGVSDPVEAYCWRAPTARASG